MVWLLTHIWVGLALAALLGLLIGWSFRGLLLAAKAREAIVNRDIALTELEQSRLEIDQLYAAQSKGIDAAAQAGDDTLRRELEAREEKLQSLGQELATSRSELEDLKSKAVLGAGAALAGAAGVAGAVLGSGDGAAKEVGSASAAPTLDADLNLNDASLQWRNRYLASRVRALEIKDEKAVEPVVAEPDTAEFDAAILRAETAETALEALKIEAETGKEKLAAAALAASAAAATGAAMLTDDADEAPEGEDSRLVKQTWQSNYLRQRLASASDVSADLDSTIAEPAMLTPDPIDVVAAEKQAWQGRYLRQRIAYMEENPPTPRAILLGEAEDEVSENVEEVSIAADEIAVVDVPEGASTLEQELARLRWRNRYLEGRLAYIDGDAPKSEAELASQSVDVAIEDGEGAGLPEVETGQDSLDDVVKVEEEAQAIATPEPTPAESVLAAMENSQILSEAANGSDPFRPDSVAKPDDGGDDLTRIEGVEPATAAALNEVGIWHYHQVAGWTPENTNWVNANLGAEGDIEPQDWIAQAGALSLGADIE